MEPVDTYPWTIVGQEQTTQPDAAGRFQLGVNVTFRTRDGHQGVVFIPAAQYTERAAFEAVDKAATTMLNVAQLHG
jgi:hypothetical protein